MNTPNQPQGNDLVAQQTSENRLNFKTLMKGYLDELFSFRRPLKRILEVIAMSEAKKDEWQEGGAKPKEEKRQRPENFLVQFYDEISLGIDNVEEAIKMQKALKQFNLGLILVSKFSSNNERIINGYFHRHGIENYREILQIEEMQQKSGPLYSSIIKALQFFGKPAARSKFFGENKSNVHFQNFLNEVIKWHKGVNSPKNRQKIKLMLESALESFYNDVESNPNLKTFLSEITSQIADHKSNQDASKEQKRLNEYHKKAIENIFERRTPKFKEILHQLFCLKGLDARRSFELMRTEVGKELMEQLNIETDELYEEIAHKHLGEEWNEFTDNEEICDFLLNTSFGRKLAREQKIDFSRFQNAITEGINGVLEDLLDQLPEGVKTSSLDGLIAQMMENPNISIAGDYEEIILIGNERYLIKRVENKLFWQAINNVYNKETKSSALEQAKNAVKELKNNFLYRDTIEYFDLLAKVMQKMLIPPTNKLDMQKYRSAVQKCMEAYGDTEEGFNRDYSQNMPGISSEDCDFSKIDKSKPFDFNKLIELYAAGISDTRLVDIKKEIETQIIHPLMVELGIVINSRDKFKNSGNEKIKENYITEEDFDMAKQMKENLFILNQLNLQTESVGITEEKDEEEENTLTQEGKEFIDKNTNIGEAEIKTIDQKIAAKEAKKETKKAAN
jgi:hypothetical protein